MKDVCTSVHCTTHLHSVLQYLHAVLCFVVVGSMLTSSASIAAATLSDCMGIWRGKEGFVVEGGLFKGVNICPKSAP